MIDPNVLKNTLSSPESDGLFSLKALHQSCGGERKDQPNRWRKLESTQAFEKYLGTKTGSLNKLTSRTVEGRNGDTYVCRSLVIDYASWVSPVFREMVIDVFDSMFHGNSEHAESLIKIYQGHQPNHPNSLPALLNTPRSQCEPYFDALRQSDIVGRTWKSRKPQAIYHAGIKADGLVIGKHGNTLLFDKAIIDVFPKQLLIG